MGIGQCPKCDVRKAIRDQTRDRAEKNDGKVSIEYLGFNCKRCGRRLTQVINYNKQGSKRITWKYA